MAGMSPDEPAGYPAKPAASSRAGGSQQRPPDASVLHHLVADAPWSDEAVLDRSLDFVLPAMLSRGPVVAWLVDDTGFPKKANIQSGWRVSTVVRSANRRTGGWRSAFRSRRRPRVCRWPSAYLPEIWANDSARRETAGVPADIAFRTKPEIALAQIRRAAIGASLKAWCWPTLAMEPTAVSARS